MSESDNGKWEGVIENLELSRRDFLFSTLATGALALTPRWVSAQGARPYTLGVQPQLRPAHRVERPGEPDARVPASRDELPAGHALGGVAARDDVLSPQIGLEFVGHQGARAERHLAPAADQLGLEPAHARLVDEAVVVAIARRQIVQTGVDDPVVRAPVPAQLHPVTRLCGRLLCAALRVEARAGTRHQAARAPLILRAG